MYTYVVYDESAVRGGYTGVGSLYIVIIAFFDIRLFVSGGEDEVSRWPSVSADWSRKSCTTRSSLAVNVFCAAP